MTVDSSERALDALPALEGVSKDASREACASLEDGVLVGGLPTLLEFRGRIYQIYLLRYRSRPGLQTPALIDQGYLTD